jgi:hypothetical protein
MPPDELIPAGFAQGYVRYSDYDPSQPHPRIIIPVRFGHLLTRAMVDTGAPWCVLSPEEAEALNIQSEDGVEIAGLSIRGYRLNGHLHRIPVSIDPDRGHGITVESTVFIAHTNPDAEWRLPNFVGLEGFLHRIRFAVDPDENLFYFGSP